MSKVFRRERIESEILKILSESLKDFKCEGVDKKYVSFTRAELSGDKRHAKIYVSVFDPDGDEKRAEETFELLKEKIGYFRGYLGNRVRLYHIPELHFIFDRGIKQSVHMQKVLDNLDINEEDSQDNQNPEDED